MSKQSRDDDLFEAKKVVRKFSWKTYAENPDDELAKSLVAAEALDRQDEKDEAMLGAQWRQMFDPATSKAFGYVDSMLATFYSQRHTTAKFYAVEVVKSFYLPPRPTNSQKPTKLS